MTDEEIGLFPIWEGEVCVVVIIIFIFCVSCVHARQGDDRLPNSVVVWHIPRAFCVGRWEGSEGKECWSLVLLPLAS